VAPNPLLLLATQGQSVWLDNLSRPLVRDGGLAALLRDDGIKGITSNPAIFHKAMTGSAAYDDDIARLAGAGKDVNGIYEALAIQDIREAADLLRPIHAATKGEDGYVSLEVSPHLARDMAGTVSEARRLWRAVDRPNVMIKIPGTLEGLPAIRACLEEGININITLLFSIDVYKRVVEAHHQALAARLAAGRPIDAIGSVASFFISRIDTSVDAILARLPGGPALQGEAAIASAKLAYHHWREVHAGAEWRRLAAAGARPQRLLWASTSTKNPAYPDVKYVEPLIGPKTVNTMPDETIVAFRDHGRVAATLEAGLDEARRTLARLAEAGVDLHLVTADLVEEGIRKFVDPFDALLAALAAKRAALVRT
jgi:transaldolase